MKELSDLGRVEGAKELLGLGGSGDGTENSVKTHVHAPKLLVAGVDFLTLGASNWPGVRAGRSPFPLQGTGLSLCHQTRALPWGSCRSLTVLGDKKGKPGWECEQALEGSMLGESGWGLFSSSSVAPPLSQLWNFPMPGHYARLMIRIICVCMFLISVLEKLRYSVHFRQQLFLLRQRETSKPQPLTFQH